MAGLLNQAFTYVDRGRNSTSPQERKNNGT